MCTVYTTDDGLQLRTCDTLFTVYKNKSSDKDNQNII